VFFSLGSVIYVVEGNREPVIALLIGDRRPAGPGHRRHVRRARRPGAYQVLNGPAVIEATDVHGTRADLFLVRIGS
jgi:hypothetical protein